MKNPFNKHVPGTNPLRPGDNLFSYRISGAMPERNWITGCIAC